MELFETAVTPAFVEEVARSEGGLNLARAGLLFAQSHYPNLDCATYLRQIDQIASDISARLDGENAANERLALMNAYLFTELGFAGNTDNYYDPRNSFLNEVLDRRIGLPISLSVLYLEIAQRLAIPARGIAFPGHFLIGVTTEAGDLIVDAFDNGAHLPRAQFIQRLRERSPGDRSLQALERALGPASKRDILLRQLRNLKAVYSELGDVEKTLNITNHLLVTQSDLMPELLERASLFDSLGYAPGAITDYERALQILPAGIDQQDIVDRLKNARGKAGHLH